MASGSSQLRRRMHTVAGGYTEFEKLSADILPWSWNWRDEFDPGYFGVAPQLGFVKIYDKSALKYRDSADRSWEYFTEMAAWPTIDASSTNDALYFGLPNWPQDAAFEIDTPSTLAVYAGNACTWEYYNGAAWTALTLVYDETDTTANDGKRPFQQAGEIRFNKPTDMASVDVDGVTAEWIRVRPSTPGNVTTVPIFAYTECAEFVCKADYVDSGVTRTREFLETNTTSCLVTGIGYFECTVTSSLGREIKKRFDFVEPDTCREDDYGN